MTVSDSVLAVRLEAKLTTLEKQMARAVAVVDRDSGTMEKRVANSNRRMSKSAKESARVFERELARKEKATKSLLSSLDPVFAATERLRRQEKLLNEALRSGIITTQQHAAAMRQSQAQYDLSTKAAGRAAVATAAATQAHSRMVRVSRGGRGAVQNAAFQFSDIAVQLEMGTAASRVMAQQLPQLLGGFGALGAVLGAVIAIGIPVSTMLFSMGEDSEDTGEKVGKLADMISEAEREIRSANESMGRSAVDSMADARRAYGGVTAEVIEMMDALSRADKAGALSAVVKSLKAFLDQADGLGEFRKALSATEDEVEALRDQLQAELDLSPATRDDRAIRDLREEIALREQLKILAEDNKDFGLNPEALRGIADVIGQIQAVAAGGAITKDFPDALAKAARSMEGIDQGPLRNLDDEFRRIEEVSRRWLGAVEGGDDSLTSGANSASGMADELERAAEASRAIHSMIEGAEVQLANARIRLEHDGNPVETAAALAAAAFDREASKMIGVDPVAIDAQRQRKVSAAREAAEIDLELSRRRQAERRVRRGGRSNSKPSDITDQAAARKAALELEVDLIGKSGAAAAELRARYELLQRAKAAGHDLDKKSISTGATLRQEIGQQAFEIGLLTEAVEQHRALQSIDEAGSSRVSALQLELSLVGRSASEVAGLALKHQLLNEAKQAGIDVDIAKTRSGETLREQIQRQADTVTILTERLAAEAEATQFAANAKRDLKDGFLDAIIEGRNFAGVMADVAKSLARASLEAALFGTGPASSAGGGGGGGGLFGAALSFGGSLLFRANGGWIRGPGSSTSDSVPVAASNGEFMVNAKAAARHGSLLEAINSGADPFAIAGRTSSPIGGAAAAALAVRIFVDDDGQLAAIAKEAGRRAGAEAALPVSVEVVKAHASKQATIQHRSGL